MRCLGLRTTNRSSMIRWRSWARYIYGHLLLRHIWQFIRLLNIRLRKSRQRERSHLALFTIQKQFFFVILKILTIWWMWCEWFPASTFSCVASCGWFVASGLQLSLIIFVFILWDKFVGADPQNGSIWHIFIPAWPSMLLCSSDVRSVDAEPEPAKPRQIKSNEQN